jgi:prepilin-type N-terminal cleavage/methylation domain-containing protein
MRDANKTDRGFTLIEALVSMGILVVGVLGLMHMAIYTAQSTGAAQRKTVAVALARDLVDQISTWLPTDQRLIPTLSSNPRTLTCANTNSVAGMTTCTASSNFLPLPPSRPLVAGTDVDHVDADLGPNYPGQALPPGFERVWDVYPLNFNHANHTAGMNDVTVVVVVVRYWQNGEPQDVALTASLVAYSEVVKAGIL